MGRFISRDPLEFAGGLNLYRYMDDNPVALLDPFGLAPEKRRVERSLGDQLQVDEADGIVYRPSERGNAPLDVNGDPIELHHRNQRPEGPIDELTVDRHRKNGNQKALHPSRDSEVCHGKEWDRWRRDYWREQWDKGRFKNLPAGPPFHWSGSPDGVEPDESFDLFLIWIITELRAPEIEMAPEPIRPPPTRLPVPDPRLIRVPNF